MRPGGGGGRTGRRSTRPRWIEFVLMGVPGRLAQGAGVGRSRTI